VAVGLIALVPAGAAQAAIKQVDMGVPAAGQKKIQDLGGDVNDFFPHGITIHVGDSIRFIPDGFHTAEFPKTGAQPVPLAGPSGTKVTGQNDPAGNPFWFNGLDDIQFTAAVVKSGFGKKFTYTGKTTVQSGLPLADKPKPMTVKFPKVGSFTYYCNVHAGMKGTVKVVAKSKKAPTAKADKKTVAKQLARSINEVKALVNDTPPAGTVDVGPSGPHGSTLYTFAPATTTVPVGTTLKYVMPKGSFEVHTATAGPDDPETPNPTGYLGKLAASIQGPKFDPAAVYPSDQPGPTPPSLTLTSHGNGFWNTGFMDTASTSPLPSEGSVTFAQAGRYDLYCLVHPFMHQVVTVTG
jgi:plastocyanin